MATVRNVLDGKKILIGADFILAVRKALGIDVIGQRVIIDAKCDGIVTIYFQGIGDDRLLNIDLDALLQGADVVVVNKK